jgi:phosphotransferase family enzyme
VKLADVLSGDAGLAGVQWLLLAPGPRRVLRHELATMLGDPHILGPCRLRRAKFKPGRKLTAYYEADLRDTRGRPLARRPIAATWTAEVGERRRRPVPEVAELEAEAAGRGLANPFRVLEAVVPDWSMHVLVSPLDVRFPQLVRLSHPSFLSGVVHGPGCRVTPIRYRPGQRHVLRYDLERRDGSPETIYAKLYEDERGERTFEVATRVADWLATNTAGYAAVRPLAYLADSHTVLYPALGGAPLSRRLMRRGGHRAKRLRQAGALLRSLHQAPLALAAQQKPHELADEVRAVARASEHIDVLEPEAASRIAAILERAQELHDRLPHERATLVHGDLKLDHLWPAPEGLTLIDLDRCCVADPALDIGKLLADLHWQLSPDRAGLRQAQRQFLDGYAEVASSARVSRARVYEAILLAKIAARRVRLFDRRWQPVTEALLVRGENVLADLDRQRRAQRARTLRLARAAA